MPGAGSGSAQGTGMFIGQKLQSIVGLAVCCHSIAKFFPFDKARVDLDGFACQGAKSPAPPMNNNF